MRSVRKLPLVFAIALLVALTAALCACNESDAPYTVYYDGADAYTEGPVEGITAQEVYINWVCGSIKLAVDEEATGVSVREEGKNAAPKLKYLLEDGKLSIQFAALGSYEATDDLKKALTITFPKALCLDRLEISAHDADVTSLGVPALRCKISTRRGAVAMYTASDNMATCPRDISVDTVSGGIGLNICDPVLGEEDEDGVKISTASGAVNCKVNAQVPLLRVKTSSGSVEAEFNAAPLRFEVDTLSGNMQITAPLAPRIMHISASASTLNFKLNRDDAFRLVTDAQLAISFVDLSHREEVSPGNFCYTYRPDGFDGSSLAEYEVVGVGSILKLEYL